ncbi:MAG TPA: alpha/beta hydrolase domain-containing protein [Rhodopila sp.]|uniref:alpha/beta hydrolase domain-containing protein n=1 Tax=Rhodopila sp. TaxID=2480087 RepID=UPI002CADE4A7|nr:alpha/beta hydrolase domain-containing protein [Rhodopila sp.]HVY13884.1 alpha/beta hydrolase domain-containing protein [Rhodopila sp.]
MIVGIEIKSRSPFAGGASFGDTGAYVRIEGTATGALDPAHPGNAGIALLDKAPRDPAGRVGYRSDFILLCPADPAKGNGRLLYEVNNRGRIMIFANLCAGAAGNQPASAADLGNALPLKRGFSMLWSGWDPVAPKATGLSLEVPVIEGIVQPIREEFVSGTRLGVHEAFKLSYDAVGAASVTVRRTQAGDRRSVASETIDGRTVRLREPIETGSIYEVRYRATKPRVLGIGYAATRDVVSHVRRSDLVGRPVTHTLAFGISQAGRYLRDHLWQGFNADEDGRRVFDGVYTHVAGIGKVFHNTPFGQPFRTRTWHEDHDFPEVAFPFSAAPMDDPLTGLSGSVMRGDATDPKLIETNTSTEYWQKGASLLHTDPLGQRDVEPPANVRTFLIAGSQHAGKAGMPRDAGPCAHPRNWHDPMPAVRALLVALDAWVAEGKDPPASRVPRIADGSLVPADRVAFPAIPGMVRPKNACDAAPLGDWTDPKPAERRYGALVPQVDADGNEIGGIRLPDIAVPLGTFTGWNVYKAPYPDGELADRDGSFLAFAATEAERGADPRASLATRGERSGRLKAAAEALRADRLLLAEDAATFG